jgi:phosphate transport system substrate-binding protein
MTLRLGRCTNPDLCQIAASQKIVEIDSEDPFICPRCSADLVEVPSKVRASMTSPNMLILQGLVILAGAGILGYKLAVRTTAPATPPGGVVASTAPAAAPPPSAAAPSAPAATTAADATPATPQAAGPAPTVLLRLAGSDVIANRLARRLAAGYLALIGDTDISTQPGATPGMVDIVGVQAGQREAIAITQSSSTAGLNSLLRGDADIALTVRPVSTSEIESLANLGDMTSPDAEHVAGVDAVAAIVNPAIRLDALTRAQLTGILSGKIRNWSEVGAAPGAIHAYVRDGAGGQADTPASLFFANPAQAVAAHFEADDAAVAAAVRGDPCGIGLVDLAAAGGARVVSVGDAAAPLAPTDIAVATEDYPLTRRLYLYNATTPGMPGSANFARRFNDYVASTGGQAVVEAAGFVSLSVKTQQAAAPRDASQRFRGLVAGATQVSTTFRFQPGSALLDSRASRDVDRLVAFLRTRHSTGDQLILAGFADNTGAPASNAAVAQKRVDVVAAALTRAGITAGHAEGFGADVPVADNATAEGREKNRRVEVYVTQ